MPILASRKRRRAVTGATCQGSGRQAMNERSRDPTERSRASCCHEGIYGSVFTTTPHSRATRFASSRFVVRPARRRSLAFPVTAVRASICRMAAKKRTPHDSPLGGTPQLLDEPLALAGTELEPLSTLYSRLFLAVDYCAHSRSTGGHGVRGCLLCGAISVEPNVWKRPALHARLSDFMKHAARELPTKPIGFHTDHAKPLVAPGESVDLYARPQVVFRGEVLCVAKECAPYFEVTDLAVEHENGLPAQPPEPTTDEEDRAQLRDFIAYTEERLAREKELLAELGKPYAERSENAKRQHEWKRTPKDFASAKRFDSQFVAAGCMPSDAVHRFDCDTCTPGNRVRLTVCNVSERSLPFAAVLVGRVAT